MTGSIWSTYRSPCAFPRYRCEKGAHTEGFSRSRGGFASKVHAQCDDQERPLGFVLTGGHGSDYRATGALTMLPVPNPQAMLADRGYDSDSFRQDLVIHRILTVIPSRQGRSVPQKTDWWPYIDRNRIARMFKHLRCAASRPDTTRLPCPL
ncbi:transposase [Gluconobacter japonicus]|uniref:transposase n=1 Tax=Gluconobacter japonicus TaxID=376620 RepID=UPI0038D133EE